ncbi:hypothetical protein QYE76_058639 [Lolium multiflorum]|uniref:Uncharacterized protein n=1 Tax=Lolium multiflorum TaxID=4521 RepID=A0AAD8WSM0_LOLMU|nr:hypothetical protein QYE76_058639 [Lolium multiflorum]
MIRPCFLPVGMSTSNRIIKPGYESYLPVVAARQFGLGQVSPHFFLHHLTESRADLPDVLTGQRCYYFFDALAIPVPHNLSFTSSTAGFESWWPMWKTHAFKRALGPFAKQLDVNMISLQNSNKMVQNMYMMTAPPSNSSQQLRWSSSAKLTTLEKGLLSFDPESIEPAPSTTCDEPGPSAILGQFQRLKALLSSPIETLVEDPEEVKSVLEEIQPHLPVTLQVKLWPVVTLSAYRSRVKLARQRIDLCHAQVPLKADIADRCQRLNEKKAALDAKTDISVSSAELETLRKELEDLEERVRATKQLIQDKKALIAHSQEEAEGLKAQLKTDLAEIRALNKQLVTGKDEDDEAEISKVDRVCSPCLCIPS